MKIFTGYHQPSGGQLYFEGRPVQFRSVGHARSLGIEAVYQDLALVNELNVYRNMFLQREPVFGGRWAFSTSARCAGGRSRCSSA